MHHNTREEFIDSLASFLGGMIDGSEDPISKAAGYLLDDLDHLKATEQDVKEFCERTFAEISPNAHGQFFAFLSVTDPAWNIPGKFDFSYSGGGIAMISAPTVEELKFQVAQHTPEMLKAKEIAELKNRLAKLEG